ncbi:MAG: hypothetical protein U0930_22130 [Pirellulales bacterium]
MAVLDLATLVEPVGTVIYGEQNRMGISVVGGLGDVNNDGYEYFAVSNSEIPESGALHVVFGKARPGASIDLTNLGSGGVKIQGLHSQHGLGVSVSSAGDTNGDGFGDFLVGALNRGISDGNLWGEAYLIFGSSSLPAVIDLSALGSGGVRLLSPAIGSLLGLSVSGAGDVNADGYSDIIVGAPSSIGKSYLVFGRSNFPTTIDVSQITGLVTITGSQSDFAGHVSGSGDVNGDGYSDLLIGAPGGDAMLDAKTDAGESYIVFGGPSLPASIQLSNLGSAGVTIFGADAGDRSGGVLNILGDVNGDGFDEIAIAAQQADSAGNAKPDAGESYIVFGKAALPATIDLAALGNAGATIWGADTGDLSGFSLDGAGDLNADGYDDLIIGALAADSLNNSRTDAGESYVIFGGAALASSIDLAALGNSGLTIWGADSYDESGNSVGGAGDVNGDGFDDLLIGAPGGDGLGNNSLGLGESYLVLGANQFTNSVTHPGTAASETLIGSAAANVMVGGRGNDVLVGNGGGDILRAGQGNDVLAVSSTNFKRINGGTGNDVLRLDGAGLSLNLTSIKDNRISNVETIDLTGSGNNTLTLNQAEC